MVGVKAANVATFAHIAGGLCGSLFGFLIAPKKRAAKKTAAEKPAPVAEKSPYGAESNPVRSSVDALREKLRARQEKLHGEREQENDDDSTVIGTLEL